MLTPPVLLALLVAGVLLWPARSAPVPWSLRGGQGDGQSGGQAGAGTGVRRRRWPRRVQLADLLEERAALADLVAAGLEAGLPVSGAWALAGALGGGTTDGVGGSPALGLAGRAKRIQTTVDGDLLACALVLSERAGTPTAMAARAGASALHRAASAHRKRAALLAGPRASMVVLTALPFVGPLLALVIGLPLGDIYGNARALSAVSVGLVLTVLGWIASRAILAAAVRPAAQQRSGAVGRRRPR